MPAPNVAGTITSYGLDDGRIRIIEPAIDMLSPTDLPLQNGYTLYGGVVVRALGREEVEDTKFEWQEDTDLDGASTLAAGYTSGGTTMTVADGSRFLIGDVIRVGAENLYVSNVVVDALTVAGAQQGTVAANHASGDQVFVIGQDLGEGAVPQQTNAKDRVAPFNYTEILGPFKVQITGTADVIPRYGVASEFNYQLAMRSLEKAKSFERVLLYGTRFQDVATTKRKTGGFDFFITQNIDTTTPLLTTATIGNQLQNVHRAGADTSEYMLLTGYLGKRQVSSLDTDKVQITREDRGRGQMVEYLDTDFGRVAMSFSRYCLNNNAFGYTRDQAKIRTLRPWQVDDMAKTRDAREVMCVAEKGLEFKRQQHSFKFTALSTVPT